MFVCAECGAAQPEAGYCGVDGSALHPRGEDPLLGTTIGPYRVARLMGIGGMGRVYRAVHPTIGSRVAIKILSRESSERPDLVERFFAEAKAVNLIRHEAIVNVLDLATLPDGRPYIVMEHLEGSSLAAIIDEARRTGRLLPLGGVARLVVEVLEGLGAAHAKGIVHRDLKPDNIFVTPQGRAKILDFGIAKLQPDLGATTPSNPTQTGSLLGTPHYMSPEQAAGRPVDARSDLYSLGVILFELSTCQRPFSPPALFDLLRMHIEAPPPLARSLRAAIPEALEQVINIALAKTAEQRFATAVAMSAALQNATTQLAGDQWEPILGGRKSQPNLQPVAWAPTPPASWASGPRDTDRASHLAPPTDRQAKPPTVDRVVMPQNPSHPSPPQTPSQAHPSTQTAGQVGAPAPQGSSKKTALLVLGGLALAGGGIAVGVIASKGSSNDTVAATGSDTAGTGSGSAGSGAGSAGSGAGSGSAITNVPVAPQPSLGGELSPEQTADMDAMIRSIPPEKQPPALVAALKKYGAWSKIPDAERQALLVTLTGMVGMGGAANAMDEINNALSGLDTEPAPTPPPAPKLHPQPDANANAERGEFSDARDASGWIKPTFALRYAGYYDPHAVDVHMLVNWTSAGARKLYSDAKLTNILATNVNGSAQADVTGPVKMVSFRYVVPSRPDGECAFLIVMTKEGAMILRDVAIKNCKKDVPVLKPTCGVLDVIARARQQGVANSELVDIMFTSSSKMWSVAVVGEALSKAKTIPDTCGAAD